MRTQKLPYADKDIELEGYLAYNADISRPRPAIMIVHDWSGKNSFACQKAEQIAQLGYVGFAVDMFGKGVLGTTKEEKNNLIQPFVKERFRIQQRMQCAYQALEKIDVVDNSRVGSCGQ